MPERALLNDLNPYLVSFYRWLQRGLRIDIPLENSRETYYKYRERFNKLIQEGKASSREAAALFYYLNRTGYNGLCRFNSRGAFNVPFGRYKKISYLRDFSAYKHVFERWEFICMDFEAICLNPEDFVYADPPYDVEFTEYAPGGFSWADQVRLVRWLARHPGPVVISNQATDRILRLYREAGFDLQILNAPRRIACNGDRTPAQEVLATKNLTTS